jgi:hypothetical protein
MRQLDHFTFHLEARVLFVQIVVLLLHFEKLLVESLVHFPSLVKLVSKPVLCPVALVLVTFTDTDNLSYERMASPLRGLIIIIELELGLQSLLDTMVGPFHGNLL